MFKKMKMLGGGGVDSLLSTQQNNQIKCNNISHKIIENIFIKSANKITKNAHHITEIEFARQCADKGKVVV